MNIEDLTKSQLILLTVLVNFVTSIATGILTVSLLDTVPPVVTQTVNRIVEHTIETVSQAAPATVIQAPKPSVEDLITSAFAADAARSIMFYDVKLGTSTPLALGTYLPKAHAAVAMVNSGLPKEVLVGFADGSIAAASISRTGDIVAIYSFPDSAKLPSLPTLSLIAAKDLKIGQTALALTPDGGAATGIVSKVNDGHVTTSLPKTSMGVAAVDLSGNLIGISIGGETGLFVSTDKIRELLAATSTPSAPVVSP
jgi:hypothetical protein